MKKPYYSRKERQLIVNHSDSDAAIELIKRLEKLKLRKTICKFFKMK